MYISLKCLFTYSCLQINHWKGLISLTLEQFLRGKLSTNFVPLIKKDKCEICNSKDKLRLHHIKPFAIMLEETLVGLDLKYYKDKDNYTDIEIKNITNVMLGKHLDSYYLTLCKDCHSHLHRLKMEAFVI